MSTKYEIGNFHWVLYDSEWTIAQMVNDFRSLGEDSDHFNMWNRWGARYANRQSEFKEIDPNPIKREA